MYFWLTQSLKLIYYKMARKKVRKQTTNVPQKKTSLSNKTVLKSLGILLSCIAFVIYVNTFNHDYALDDASAISANYVTKQGISGIPTLFKEHYRFGYWNSPGTLYRPIPLAMFAIEWQIAPDSPGFYHFMNVLLYALTAFILFLTLCKMIPKYSPALPFLTTLLFITHPVHVEVVANIKSRDEILSFLFCIFAVYFLWKYLKFENKKWLAFSLFSYLLAMFSIENAITFLAIFPLLMYFFTSAGRHGRTPPSREAECARSAEAWRTSRRGRRVARRGANTPACSDRARGRRSRARSGPGRRGEPPRRCARLRAIRRESESGAGCRARPDTSARGR